MQPHYEYMQPQMKVHVQKVLHSKEYSSDAMKWATWKENTKYM